MIFFFASFLEFDILLVYRLFKFLIGITILCKNGSSK